MHENNQRGYIALMSAIIISVLLLSITVGIGLSGFFSRSNILDAESKERSQALAEACGDQALLNFSQGLTSTGVVSVGHDNCTIISVTPKVGQTTIKTQAVINHAYSNIKIIVDTNTLGIISWDECANFDNTCL